MFGIKKIDKKCSDEQLVSSMITGDSKAFNEIYSRYNQRLLYYFYRMLGNSSDKAQDFVQDIFIKLIDKAHYFDTNRKFSTWIFSIAYNMCKNEYRNLGVRNNMPIEQYAEHLTDDEFTVFNDPTGDPVEFVNDLFTELNNFDDTHKTVFLLHYREGFSLKDISQTLEISEGTVKSRLFYTRKRLAEKLARYQSII